MKARVKATGQIVEVQAVKDSYFHNGVCYKTSPLRKEETHYYSDFDLDFDVEEETDSDLRISVAKLREVLGKMQGNLLNDAVIDKIINKVKSKLCATHIKSA